MAHDDIDLNQLKPEELVTLWKELETLDGGEGFLDRIPLVNPSYLAPYHLQPIADAIHRIRMGEEVRVCISVPPRHGKTESLLFAPSYLWEVKDMEVAYITASGDAAEEKSMRAFGMAERVGYKPEGKRGLWRINEKSTFRALGIGGQFTGHGADLIIIDDPFKDRLEAESLTQRNNVYDYYTSVAETRLMPGGSMIVVQTRWHPDDLIGRLHTKDEWEYINLPALSVDDGNLTALWQDFWTLDTMLKKRRAVGDYDWNSMYMGNPRPKGSRIFDNPHRYSVPRIDNSVVVAVCDPAATANTRSDNSAIVIGAFSKDKDGEVIMDVLHVWKAQVEPDALVQRIVDTSAGWGCAIGIETVHGFKAIPHMVRKIDKNARVYEITPKGDKFTRAQPAAAAWNAGRIRVPSNALVHRWIPDFIKEVTDFTGVSDPRDDQVDALVHCWNVGYANLMTRNRSVVPVRLGAFG